MLAGVAEAAAAHALCELAAPHQEASLDPAITALAARVHLHALLECAGELLGRRPTPAETEELWAAIWFANRPSSRYIPGAVAGGESCPVT